MLQIVDQGILSHQSGRGAFMPFITLLADGSFIAAQHIGTGLGAPDNDIEILRSADGRAWISDGQLHDRTNREWAYRGPQISELPGGGLVMKAGRCQITGGNLFDPESEGLAHYEMLLLRSSDGGRTWSEPAVVDAGLSRDRYTANDTGTFLQIAPDRWIYPLETWKPHGWKGPPDQKAAALFSHDQGTTWGDFTVVADDTDNRRLWWDQMNCILANGRLYTMFWTHLYGTSDDLNNHWVMSDDEGRTWSEPRPTNLHGQVCTPIPLADGRVAAIYNYRREPQGIRVAVTEDLTTFDLEREVVVFDAGAEATLGDPESDNFLAEHLQIAFGKPVGVALDGNEIMTAFWCTAGGVTHTRWVRLRV